MSKIDLTFNKNEDAMKLALSNLKRKLQNNMQKGK